MKSVNTVQKMAPQEMAILENIGSLLDQLRQGGSMNDMDGMIDDSAMASKADEMDGMVSDTYEDDMSMEQKAAAYDNMMKAAKGDMMDDDPDMTAAKADEGPTVEDPAETRLMDGTEITEDNYSEVGKSLRQIEAVLTKMAVGSVRKSSAAPQEAFSTPVMKALSEMTGVLKGLMTRQEQSEAAFSGLLEGMGVADQINQQVVKSGTPQAPTGALDGAAVLKDLTVVLKDLASRNNAGDGRVWRDFSSEGRNDLKQAMPGLLGKRM